MRLDLFVHQLKSAKADEKGKGEEIERIKLPELFEGFLCCFTFALCHFEDDVANNVNQRVDPILK